MINFGNSLANLNKYNPPRMKSGLLILCAGLCMPKSFIAKLKLYLYKTNLIKRRHVLVKPDPTHSIDTYYLSVSVTIGTLFSSIWSLNGVCIILLPLQHCEFFHMERSGL